jgi:hypothetical protein
MKTSSFAAAALLTAAVAAPSLADGKLEGCYVPQYGFAKSLCTDSTTCASQAGLYRIVLRNDAATVGKRRLVMSGMFQGLNVQPTESQVPECQALASTSHLLMDKGMAGSIETGPDSVCMTGGGDFVNTVEVMETLTVSAGEGIYANIVPGGRVTMLGTIAIKTGVNSFKITPQPEDMICFEG